MSDFEIGRIIGAHSCDVPVIVIDKEAVRRVGYLFAAGVIDALIAAGVVHEELPAPSDEAAPANP